MLLTRQNAHAQQGREWPGVTEGGNTGDPLPPTSTPTAAISSPTTSSTPQGETVQVKSKDVVQLEGFAFDVVLEYIQFQGFALDEGLEYIIMCKYLIDNKGRTKKENKKTNRRQAWSLYSRQQYFKVNKMATQSREESIQQETLDNLIMTRHNNPQHNQKLTPSHQEKK